MPLAVSIRRENSPCESFLFYFICIYFLPEVVRGSWEKHLEITQRHGDAGSGTSRQALPPSRNPLVPIPPQRSAAPRCRSQEGIKHGGDKTHVSIRAELKATPEPSRAEPLRVPVALGGITTAAFRLPPSLRSPRSRGRYQSHAAQSEAAWKGFTLHPTPQV